MVEKKISEFGREKNQRIFQENLRNFQEKISEFQKSAKFEKIQVKLYKKSAKSQISEKRLKYIELNIHVRKDAFVT